MKILAGLLMIFAAALIAAAQARPHAVVFFSGDPGCGFKGRGIESGEKFGCSTVNTTRGPVSTVTHDGISITVAFVDDEDFNVVGAAINNSSSEPVYFDTDNWGAAHFKSKADFAERRKPLAAELSIPTRDIVRGISSGVRTGNSLDTFMAESARTSELKEVRRSDGTRYRVSVIVPDKQAQEDAGRQNDSRSLLANARQRQLRETALTAKSVGSEATIKGLVYFRKVKNADFVMYSLSVADTTYVFLLPKKS